MIFLTLICKRTQTGYLLQNLTEMKISYGLEKKENMYLKICLLFLIKVKKKRTLCKFPLKYGHSPSLIWDWMIWLKFRVFVKNFTTHVKKLVSTLKNYKNQREYSKKETRFFLIINSYMIVFILICLGN